MRKASSILYLINGIFCAIAAIVYIVVGIMGMAGAINNIPPEIQEIITKYGQTSFYVGFIVTGVFGLLFSCFGFIGSHLVRNSDGLAFHIVMIVLGALSLDLLILLASIFAVVGVRQRND